MKKPNILVFLTDDHGQWASSAYGNQEIHSPVMQWMADTGACFTRATSPNPVCSPARASFWTGRIASHHGVHDWLKEPDETHPHPAISGQENLASHLKTAGYQTAMIGKWHAGDYVRAMPGFDLWFTSLMGTNATFKEQAYIENGERLRFFGHQEQFLTDRAIRYLREDRDPGAPFMMFVGYSNTHTPHQQEGAPLTHHYRKSDFRDIPRETYQGEHGHARVAPFDLEEADRLESLAGYYAAVECIDQQMLRIVSELENQEILEDTLILYTSDHGHMNGHHGLHTKTNSTLPNNFLEETIRIPLLIRGPGIPQQEGPVSQQVDHCDTFATILDAAGVSVEEVTSRVTSPGASYLPLLRKEDSPWKTIQFCEHGPNRMACDGRYKYIQRRSDLSQVKGEDELYDLEADPRETQNVIGHEAYADRIHLLKEAMETYFTAYEHPDHSGYNPAALEVFHNGQSAWEVLPGDTDHRQN